jgi:hypothetical protein
VACGQFAFLLTLDDTLCHITGPPFALPQNIEWFTMFKQTHNKFSSSNFEININFIQFKININDVIKFFFGGEFSQFCKHKKGPSTSTNNF